MCMKIRSGKFPTTTKLNVRVGIRIIIVIHVLKMLVTARPHRYRDSFL